jgi:GH15 family glucan-1,4-alpha-glucosidase
LRDGAFCAVALDRVGCHKAAARFHDWVAARVLENRPAMRRAVDAVAEGRTPLPDDHLPCRFTSEGLSPTGDGWGTFQMDGPGLWLWALRIHVGAHGTRCRLEHQVAPAALLTAEYVAALWRQPSFDAWEEHGDRLATSTLAACLAGLRAAQHLGIGPRGVSQAVLAIQAELAARGQRMGYLPRSDTDDAIDGSILWCGPFLGVFKPEDPLWQATLRRVESDLVDQEGGVHRYAGDDFYGGGQWPVLTAALGLSYLRRGQVDDIGRARRCADWMERQRTAAGELPEQVGSHLLHPERRAAWEASWGPVATPLSWSHAMAVLFRGALDEASGPSPQASPRGRM